MYPQPTAPAYDLAALRQLFPHTQSQVFLNHAASSPLSLPVKRAMAEAIEMTSGENGDSWSATVEPMEARLRANLARLINAAPDEIALVPNTSTALNWVALSLPARAGQNIVVCRQEFPSNVYPWMNLARRAGLDMRIVPSDGGGLSLARLAECADANTLLVAVSSIEFLTGYRADLPALGAFCRERGIFLAVDGIQSLGHIPMDVQAAQVDFLAAGALKSLMGPSGIGLLYVRRDLLAELDMPVAGATSVQDFMRWTDYRLRFRPEAARFEMGTSNWIGMAGLDASLAMLMDLGLPNVDAWTTHLSAVLLADLERRGFACLTRRELGRFGPIVTFSAPDPAAALARLAVAKVTICLREGYLRASSHCYNTVDELLSIGEMLSAHGGSTI